MMPDSAPNRARPSRLPFLLIVLVLIAAFGVVFYRLRQNGEDVEPLPSPKSNHYREMVGAFYSGVAGLDAGDNTAHPDDPNSGAEVRLQKATRLGAGEPATWADLALVELRLNKLDLAAQHLEKARSLAPDNSKIEEYLGHLASKQNKPADAIAHFRRAAELNPKNVRPLYALAGPNGLLGREGGANNDAEIKSLLTRILEAKPNNLVVQIDLARSAAKSGDAETLRKMLDLIGQRAVEWPQDVRQRLDDLSKAASSDPRQAALQIEFLNNVCKQLPLYRQNHDQLELPLAEVSTPIERFIKLPSPTATPAAPDTALAFTSQPLSGAGTNKPGWVATVVLNGEGSPLVLTADGRKVDLAGKASLDFPGGASATPPSPAGVLAIDWNNDFKTDFALAGAGGLKLYQQDAGGTFTDITAKTTLPPSVTGVPLYGAWAADIDMDGDLDIVLAPMSGPPVVLQNNDDGTFKVIQPFQGVTDVRGFVWADLDGDGDQDAVFLDSQGALHVFTNERGGQFAARPQPTTLGKTLAATDADTNNDGVLDLIVLQEDGAVVRISDKEETSWDVQEIARWQNIPAGMAPGSVRLFMPDLDNNGGLDLVASGPKGTQVWLSDVQGKFQPLASPVGAQVFDVADVTNDGRLDLIGLTDSGQPVQLVNQGAKNYHWQMLRPLAMKLDKSASKSGDSRINSFAIGGMMEIRSQLLVQTQPITGPLLHFGLGDQTAADVARITWPNGDVQAEYDPKVDRTMVTQQRLKGSCPWVFAWNGKRMEFVTDFLWRSPLGLRINAQATADTVMTEDWVKIRGDQLAPKDGYYDVRITAELWETHFFDHVSLMTVDHPAGTEVYVDERFAIPPPKLAVYTTGPSHPIARAIDDNGTDVTDIVRDLDGRYLDTFGRGQYQGVTRDHYVEVELGEEAPRSGPLWLIAQGWIHPTDSSINIAISQGHHDPPHGLSLEVADGKGGWTVAKPNLGFPAGKTKTILIDLNGVFTPGAPRRLRLRTNLEIYWDRLAWAEGLSSTQLKTARIAPETAELRYHGFSAVSQANASSPELPDYENVVQTTQRWRDLIGYCTRFGDVKELLAKVDDRYVIMNAGDEMVLRFPAQAAPPAGWVRDYVLIGDGWEKDGDYNTTFSKTVLPLPTHKNPKYNKKPGRLEDDPVYREHAEDWQRYHTRYIAPDRFQRGLRPNDTD